MSHMSDGHEYFEDIRSDLPFNNSIYINFITLYRQKYNNTNHTLELIKFYDIMKEIIIINKENKNINNSIIFNNMYSNSAKPWRITPNQEAFKFEGLIYKKLY